MYENWRQNYPRWETNGCCDGSGTELLTALEKLFPPLVFFLEYIRVSGSSIHSLLVSNHLHHYCILKYFNIFLVTCHFFCSSPLGLFFCAGEVLGAKADQGLLEFSSTLEGS